MENSLVCSPRLQRGRGGEPGSIGGYCVCGWCAGNASSGELEEGGCSQATEADMVCLRRLESQPLLGVLWFCDAPLSMACEKLNEKVSVRISQFRLQPIMTTPWSRLRSHCPDYGRLSFSSASPASPSLIALNAPLPLPALYHKSWMCANCVQGVYRQETNQKRPSNML